MPKNPEIKKVLMIGSGPIVIGQAAEFDYAGTQACRSLKEEGVEVVLLNSNPATIMTDKDIADKVYIDKRRYGNFRIQIVGVYHISVVLRRNIHSSGFQILDRMIASSVTVFHLMGIRTGCQCHQLMSQTDCEDRCVGLV